MTSKIIVTKSNELAYEAVREGDAGTPVCGRGVSPLEAIGDWCVQSETVEVRCDPPDLLDEWQVDSLSPRRFGVALKPIPSRADY